MGCNMFIKGIFQKEIAEELTKTGGGKNGRITEEDIAGLPEPVQKYFRLCGIVGMEKMANAKVVWKNVLFKTSAENDYINLNCIQYNFVPEPARIVYMNSTMMGFIPMEGRDKFQNGHGNMLIKLFKGIKIADARGKEMDISALVTILAEALFVPSYALQSYITWQPLEPKKAKAVIKFNGIEVSGIFHFNDKYEFILFETEERYYSTSGKEYKKMKWSAAAGEYTEENGFRYPTRLSAFWTEGNRDIVYYKGTVDKLLFNVIN